MKHVKRMFNDSIADHCEVVIISVQDAESERAEGSLFADMGLDRFYGLGVAECETVAAWGKRVFCEIVFFYSGQE
jgi:hypothetical protein